MGFVGECKLMKHDLVGIEGRKMKIILSGYKTQQDLQNFVFHFPFSLK